jgi:enoyl-CoA hydratase/carnithine racemase
VPALARRAEAVPRNSARFRTIAQVQGSCIVGGLMLASCCDLIIAAEDALFADRAVRWGGAHVQYFGFVPQIAYSQSGSGQGPGGP